MKYSIILLLFLIVTGASTQYCGIPTQELLQLEQRLKSNKKNVQGGLITPRGAIQYVPITFHLTAKEDGAQRVTERSILDQLCALNADFIPLDIQFYIKNFNYIDNTTLFNDHRMGQTQMNTERDPLALNIFIFKNANSTNSIEDGVTFGYYSPSQDWLVMRKDQINARSIVLTHEIGHFFSLLHPYNGWDNEPWEETIHGNPAPRLSPKGVLTELQNGANCQDAGDFLCDTPPDYFFAFGWNTCNYTGNTKDPNGVIVDPDESNYMANFLEGCARDFYNFSLQQQDMIHADLQTQQRNFLRTTFTPKVEMIEDTAELLAPIEGETIPTYNLVALSWTAVEGATRYLLEIDRTPSFSVQPIYLIVNQNFADITSLLADTRYFWRIRAFNEYATCSDFSRSKTFTTGTDIDETDAPLIEDWTVFPNPNLAGARLEVNIATRRNFEADIQLFDSIGRLVWQGRESVSTTNKNFSIRTDRLAAGVYIARILVGEEHYERKVVLL